MSKKIWIAGVLALALGLIVAGAALAAPSQTDLQDPPNPPGPRGGSGRGPEWPPRLIGEITEIGEEQFSLEGPRGTEFTVEVDEYTSYLGTLVSFDDLEVGMSVAVAGHRSGEGSLVARILVAQDDLPLGTRIGGEVTAISGTTQLAIETRDGQSFRFSVSAATEFLSRENEVQSLADIAVGDHVTVLYEQTSSGTLAANVIFVAGPPPEAEEPAK